MKHTHPPRAPRLAMTAVALAVCALVNHAQAQAQSQADAPLQRVTVTGSSIKQLASENALPVTVIKADELAARGLTTMSEIATSLTVGFTNEPVGGGGTGTQINMRGLNAGRTLVLLNGRRLANEATGDSSINVDVIPIGAIDRVEILRDGASSIYGTDAIAGVVNFITKRQVKENTVTVNTVMPERQGGGQQARIGLVLGKGDLDKDGWAIWSAIDVARRKTLLQRDRPNITNPDYLLALGGSVFSSNTSGSSASPANYTVYSNGKATAVTGNPYFAAGCQAPYAGQYTIPSTRTSTTGSKTCVADGNLYPQLLPANQQNTIFTKATLNHGDNKVLSVELGLSDSTIQAENAPQPIGGQVGFDKRANVKVPLFITKASKWYPGNSGGVPAVAGLKGEDLAITWQLDELGAATTDDRQKTSRLLLTEEGSVLGWDYKLGAVYATSKRETSYLSGFVLVPGAYKGIQSGVLNPFGAQDEAGRAYLDSISVSGQANRISKVRYFGPDVSATRELMSLAGGPLQLAVGAEAHRETWDDVGPEIGNDVVYKTSATPGSKNYGERTVKAIYAEFDAPLSKKFTGNFSIRGDHFSDFGRTVNPKLSFRFEPQKNMMFRTAYSTGFRAPSIPEMYGTPPTKGPSVSKWDDPLLCPSATPNVSGTGNLTTDPKYAALALDRATVCGTQLTILSGANPKLRPETSRTFIFGGGLVPLPNLFVSLDFWRIRMKDTINQISEETIFDNIAKYNSLFVRNPDGSLDYLIKTRLNMGGLKTRGLDLHADYAYKTASWGKFSAAIDGTYLMQYQTQDEAGGKWFDAVGQPGALGSSSTSANTFVYRWRHSARVGWSNGDFATQLTQAYVPHYVDINGLASQQPGQPYNHIIDSQKMFNLTAGYTGFKNLKLSGGISNLFNVDPPLSNQRIGSRVAFAQNVSKPIGRTFSFMGKYSF